MMGIYVMPALMITIIVRNVTVSILMKILVITGVMMMINTCDPELPNEPEYNTECLCPLCGGINLDENKHDWFCHDCGKSFNEPVIVDLDDPDN